MNPDMEKEMHRLLSLPDAEREEKIRSYSNEELTELIVIGFMMASPEIQVETLKLIKGWQNGN